MRQRLGKVTEGLLHILEGAAAFGLFSGAAFAAAVGNFVLGGVLGAIALGVFARFTRRKRVRVAASAPSATAGGGRARD